MSCLWHLLCHSSTKTSQIGIAIRKKKEEKKKKKSYSTLEILPSYVHVANSVERSLQVETHCIHRTAK